MWDDHCDAVILRSSKIVQVCRMYVLYLKAKVLLFVNIFTGVEQSAEVSLN